MNNKIIIFVIIATTALILSCNKDAIYQNEVKNTELSKNAKNSVFNPNTFQSLESFSGDNIDETLESIESLLNLTYSYPEQSTGAINVSEIELNVTPENGSTLTQAEAEIIYNDALALWADTYYNFEWDNPEALLIDLERIEDSDNPNQLKIKVSAFVGEPQPEGEVIPCTTSFPTNNYQLYTPSVIIDKTKKYCGIEMNKRINKKIFINPCEYYTEVKPFYITSVLSDVIVSAYDGYLNATQMTDAYCIILSRLAEIQQQIPSGFSIASINITSDILSNGSKGRFKIQITIGKKQTKNPCVSSPKTVPPPNN